jgi:hypothetical protein
VLAVLDCGSRDPRPPHLTAALRECFIKGAGSVGGWNSNADAHTQRI